MPIVIKSFSLLARIDSMNQNDFFFFSIYSLVMNDFVSLKFSLTDKALYNSIIYHVFLLPNQRAKGRIRTRSFLNTLESFKAIRN